MHDRLIPDLKGFLFNGGFQPGYNIGLAADNFVQLIIVEHDLLAGLLGVAHGGLDTVQKNFRARAVCGVEANGCAHPQGKGGVPGCDR